LRFSAARPPIDVCSEPPSWVRYWTSLCPGQPHRVPAERPASSLRLVTDLDWAWGKGAEVQGSAEAMAMAISGRGAAVPEL